MSSSINASGSPAAPGGPSPAGTISTPKNSTTKRKAALYVDGFNLYHAIDDLGQSHLKWLNLWALGLALINKREEELSSVKWCTAHYKDEPGKRARHLAYRQALEAKGVEALLGHFVDEQHTCKHCQRDYWRMSEKQGDVNVAIHLIGDAFQDKFDHYFLVSADSDQVATAKYFNGAFPTKKLTIVAPPGRRHSQHLLSMNVGQKSIHVPTLESCLLEAMVPVKGRSSILRPIQYAPPKP
jgi:uncharacterized LabA/DUF88 family protein